MNAELEALLKADEEARARVQAAQAESASEIRKAEQDCAARRASKLETVRKQLDDEVAKIQRNAAESCLQRRSEREEYLARVAGAVDARREKAIAAYISILERGEAPSS